MIPFSRKIFQFLFIVFFTIITTQQGFAQEEPEAESQDSIAPVIKGKLALTDVEKITRSYSYNAEMDRYIYRFQHNDDYQIEYPKVLTREEYEKILTRANMRDYYKSKVAAKEGKATEEEQRDLLPKYYVNSKLFETIFGGNTIEFKPSGQLEIDLGVRYTRQDNPIISPRNRSTIALDFQPRIGVGVKGKVGKNLDINFNYDTQAVFGFQSQLYKLQYQSNEDDILQGLEVGNVSMTVKNSLVRGATNLLGIKSKLQFGATTITGVLARQQSERRTIRTEGGGTVQDFELFALDYDRDRHFFLSQYFRSKYDEALKNYPYVDSRVKITRIEVWITNRQNRVNNTDNNQRNIVALQDLAEAPLKDINPSETIGLDLVANPDFITAVNNAPTSNANNKFNPANIGSNYLNENIRGINTVSSGFNISVIEGKDFVKLENARKLSANEFKFHPQLGYISLQQTLSNDEVLAVAYEYTIGDKVYKVGEFATDGVDATTIGVGNNGQQIPTNQTLIVKLLKSNLTSTEEPVWNLMMKNIYSLGAYGLSQEGFRFNILYTDPSPLNYLKPVGSQPLPEGVSQTALLHVFHLDRLNANNDPQVGGDGYFDYVTGTLQNPFQNQNNNNMPNYGGGGNSYGNTNLQNNTFEGITVDEQNGRIIFTTVEPFGEYLFKKLSSSNAENYNDENTYNENQRRYVYRSLYKKSYTQAKEDSDKNKFQLKGKFRTSGTDGIYVGSSNLQQGSVIVTSGGRTLQEGVDYTVDYQRGYVTIIDPSLQNSDAPVQISVENNNAFNLQQRDFYGLDIEHQFSDHFLVGATMLSFVEHPFTTKSNIDNTSVSNTIYGLNFNYQNEAPFLTRWVNKLPNIDTDVPSTLSLRGEFAYLKPGASKADQLNNEATAYIDNFETTQTNIDLLTPTQWKLASVPVGFGEQNTDISSGYRRAKLSWYSIDQVFYSSTNRPNGITESDLASNKTRRILKQELFPNLELANGDLRVIRTLDLTYYPKERGPYNYNPAYLANKELPNPKSNWGGIMRSFSLTNFENANIEYLEFWLMDPYVGNPGDVANPNNTGKLYFNLGYISEDILQDGFKQYENGLPTPTDDLPTLSTIWGKVPASTALVYAFDYNTQNRVYQDAGFDGILDEEEAEMFPDFAQFPDPAADNYEYFLNAQGDIISRYKNYNNIQGNNTIEFSDTNRANNNEPDVEDIDNDNTMNTINAYFQYEIPIGQEPIIGQNYVVDVQTTTQTLNNGTTTPVRWIQYKIPIDADSQYAVGAISDLQSIKFMRMYLSGFSDDITLRFGALNLARSDCRRFRKSLVDDPNLAPTGNNTGFDVTTLNIINNATREPIPYVLPPGVVRERINQNNTVVNQNEQALSLRVYRQSMSNNSNEGLEPGDSRSVFKNMDFDMRQYKKMRMFLHAEALEGPNNPNRLKDDEMVAFIRFGNDFISNFYQIEIPLKVTEWGTFNPNEIWPLANEIELELELLNQLKLTRNNDANQDPNKIYFKDEVELNPAAAIKPNKLRIGIKGNPNYGRVRTVMLGVRNNCNVLYANTTEAKKDIRGEVWFNELRMSGLDDSSSWAANLNLDAQIADFATLSAAANYASSGFGSIEQMPQERSREELMQFSVATAVNAHQLLPSKWKLNVPISYAYSEERAIPEFDPNNPDVRLKEAIDFADSSEEKETIRNRAIDQTKRTSVNIIGLRKDLGENQKNRFYNIENFTVSQTYNQVERSNYEIEDFQDIQSRTGITYNFAFKPFEIEPFKKAEGLKKIKYLNWLTDFNLNILPTAVQFNTQINRQFNMQKYRLIDVQGLEIQPLYRRNFFFDYDYGLNFNLTRSITLTYNVNNHNVVKNYFFDDGRVNNNIGIWDDYFSIGTPNNRQQQFSLNYKIPINKIPIFAFISADYNYTSLSSWMKSSESFSNINLGGETYNLGNTIENSNTHNINVNFGMDRLYKYIGLVPSSQRKPKPKPTNEKPKPGEKLEAKEEKEREPSPLLDGVINVITGVKNIRLAYSETNGMVLPGYLPSVGFFGTSKPTLGFVFGSQADVRQYSASQGWLTTYPEFNQSFSQVNTKNLDFTADYKPFKNFTIDFRANLRSSHQLSEQYDVIGGNYHSRAPYEVGFFSISTNMLATSFLNSDVNSSDAFENFRKNRLIIAQRLAEERGIDITDVNNLDANGYPVGYGRSSQQVLIPAFLAAYQGTDAKSISLGFFKKIPLPSWNLRYTGLTDLGWFKERFKRVTLQHGYMASYNVSNYQTNYALFENPNGLDAAGNYPAKIITSNINMVERFSPLFRVDFETKKDINFALSVDKNRMLSLSLDNNLLTEVQGMDYRLEFGFRIKNIEIQTDFVGVGNNGRIVSDLLFKFGAGWQRNFTMIRYLDYNNNQIGAGSDIWRIDATAEYKFSQNFTGAFYYQHMFSRAVISTMFPVTNIRSGFSLRYNLGN